MEVDLPDVRAEVSAVYARYQKAFSENDVATLNMLFRDDPRTIRYGGGENLYGYAAIQSFRTARPSVGQSTQSGTVITTFGRDFAVASTLFHRAEWRGKVGRQTQTWVRFDAGWQIVAAHVSVIEVPPESG
jgi:hypothetical protein